MPAKHITVKSARNDDKIAFWEKHPRHPGGEVVVYGDGKAVTIGQTPYAKEAIGNGQIVILHDIPAPEPLTTDLDDGEEADEAAATKDADDDELPPGRDKDKRRPASTRQVLSRS